MSEYGKKIILSKSLKLDVIDIEKLIESSDSDVINDMFKHAINYQEQKRTVDVTTFNETVEPIKPKVEDQPIKNL